MRYYVKTCPDIVKYQWRKYVEGYLLFATDLLYYLTEIFRAEWVPIEEKHLVRPPLRKYSPHFLSPCKSSMREALDVIVEKRQSYYKKVYEGLTVGDTEYEFERFVNHVKREICELLDETSPPTPTQILLKLVHVGSIAALFLVHGKTEEADLTPSLMVMALKSIRLKPDVCFSLLDKVAGKIECLSKDVNKREELDEILLEKDGNMPNDNDEGYEESDEECETSPKLPAREKLDPEFLTLMRLMKKKRLEELRKSKKTRTKLWKATRV